MASSADRRRSPEHNEVAPSAHLSTEAPGGTDERAATRAPSSGTRSALGAMAELPVLILVAFLLALLLKTFLVQAFYIPSQSMEPTLLVGDRVLVNKVVYDLRDPRRGDVVVFTNSDEPGIEVSEPNPVTRVLRSLASGVGLAPGTDRDYIKRILGLPGETIELRGGVVYIDGQPVPEASSPQGGYLSEPDLNDFGPVTVPEGEYFMMGDNRPNSADSRFSLGTIPEDDIVGRAFVVIWPLTRIGTLPGIDYGLEAAAAPAAQAVTQADATLAA